MAGGRWAVVLRGEAGAGGVEACGEDARVVEDEEVAGLEEFWEVSKNMVGEGAGAAAKGEHAAGAADSGWSLRDEVFGEVVVKVGDEHKSRQWTVEGRQVGRRSRWWRKASPGAKAPFSGSPMRPEAEASGYLNCSAGL